MDMIKIPHCITKQLNQNLDLLKKYFSDKVQEIEWSWLSHK